MSSADVELKAMSKLDDVNKSSVEDGGGGGNEEEEGDQEDRQEWKNPFHFFVTMVGFCIGLGNIWRFPYLCQANGGGAFIIPFFVMYVIEGMPLLLLELGIGQKLRKGSFGVWKLIHPKLGGIGLGSTVIAVIVGCYYNVIISWCLYYLIRSLALTLPWSYCPSLDELLPEGGSSNNDTILGPLDPECAGSSETQFFWYRTALDISSSIYDFDGGIRWWMLLCLVASWLAVYFIIMKGIQSSGNIVYFTALFPYLVMTIFLVRGLTLKGSGAGLAHMFYPKLEYLLKPSVWLAAANQVFYSYGIALGSFIGFGSYNPKKKNCVVDVYALTACNAFTAVYACAVVFSILGFKAQQLFDKCKLHDLNLLSQLDSYQHLNITEVTDDQYGDLISTASSDLGLRNCSMDSELEKAAGGTGLAFIVMADVFTMLPGSPFWSFLFFSMLLALGLGSEIGIMEGVLGTLFELPQLKNVRKPIVSGAACLFCFTIGLLFITGPGEYWLTLVDRYGALGLTLIAFVEVVVVMYVYGHAKFTQDVHEMTGIRPGIYWQVTWRFVAPALLFVILVTSVISEVMVTPTYDVWSEEEAKSVKTEYPSFCLVLAVLLAVSSIIPILVVFLLRQFGGGDSSTDQQQNGKVVAVDAAEDEETSKPMLTAARQD